MVLERSYLSIVLIVTAEVRTDCYRSLTTAISTTSLLVWDSDYGEGLF